MVISCPKVPVAGVARCSRPETLYYIGSPKVLQVCRGLRHLKRKSAGMAPAPEYTQSGACGARGFPGKTGKPSTPAPAAVRGDGGEMGKRVSRAFFCPRKLFPISRWALAALPYFETSTARNPGKSCTSAHNWAQYCKESRENLHKCT